MTESVDLLSGIVKTTDRSGDFTTESFSLSGERYANAIVDATVSRYQQIAERLRPTDEELAAFVGEPVTIAKEVSGTFGHRAILAMEGKVFEGQRGLGILPKGKRKNGYLLRDVIDVEPGYGKVNLLQERVNRVRNHFPDLVELTQDDLNALPSRSKDCTLAIFGTYPFMGSSVPATVWLCHSYLRGDDILENVLFINPAEGESEYGSCYGKDILHWQVGKVVDFLPVSFKEAVEWTNDPDCWRKTLEEVN